MRLVMDSENVNRYLVSVLFPGMVKNEDKAIECLGGIKNISQAHSHANKRLGLSFHPENPYVRKIYSEPATTAGVLLKIRIKKSKVNDELKREVVSTEVIGKVKKVYKFDALGEFQYLPVQKEGSSDCPPRCILDDILPPQLETLDFIIKPAPLFIVPPVFTRTDKQFSYTYTDKKYLYKGSKLEDEQCADVADDIHHKKRSDRVNHIHRFAFNLTDDVPSSPTEFSLSQRKAKLELFPEMVKNDQAVAALFEERPIWSTNIIRYHTKLKLQTVKIFLPCIAYYMRQGPWRGTWVKYNYDPRKDPKARIYQILDFRVRHQDGMHSMVKKDSMHNNKKGDSVRSLKALKVNAAAAAPEEITEGQVYFRPGVAPPQRQIFFQFCDVHLPEVEEMLAAEPPPGYMCNEKHGWLPFTAGETAREHMYKYMKETLISCHLKLEHENTNSDVESALDDTVASTSMDDT